MTARPRRGFLLALAPLVALATVLVTPAGPAGAQPTGSGKTADHGEGSPLLGDVLETTGRRYLAAKSAVAKSKKRQVSLAIDVRNAEATRDTLLPQVGAVARQQYRTGAITAMSFMLNSTSSNGFLDRAISLEEINALNDGKLRELNRAIDEVTSAKARLDEEVRNQQRNLLAMSRQKEVAEKALALVGGNSLTKGFVAAKSPVADPAPRDSDGDFRAEGCSENDPTTGGCITPRTKHMYNEVKQAGFNRFVGCWRSGDKWEHPKGRACDWSLQNRGFAVAYNDDMRRYGNNLMAFLVRNADRLGVLYVIWYRQIWFPATGWKSYSGPSAHTDHVHVSML